MKPFVCLPIPSHKMLWLFAIENNYGPVSELSQSQIAEIYNACEKIMIEREKEREKKYREES